MTKDEFKKLQPGDKFTCPLFDTPLGGISSQFEIATIETSYEWPNGPGTKPIKATHTINTTDGRRMKINDTEVAKSTIVNRKS